MFSYRAYKLKEVGAKRQDWTTTLFMGLGGVRNSVADSGVNSCSSSETLPISFAPPHLLACLGELDSSHQPRKEGRRKAKFRFFCLFRPVDVHSVAIVLNIVLEVSSGIEFSPFIAA